MPKNLKLLSSLSLFVILVLMFFMFTDRELNGSNSGESSSLNQTETVMQPTADQGTVTVSHDTDPFKKFLENTVANTNGKSLAPAAVQPSLSSVPKGIDPFKEFLEKQKQNAKDQVASPFGKN